MTTPSIMAYVPTDSFGSNAGVIQPDFTNNLIYFLDYNDVTQGIRKFTGYLSGAETLSASTAAIGISGIGNVDSQSTLSYNGQLVFPVSESNTAQIAEIAALTLTRTTTFGTAGSGGGTSSDSSHILQPYSIGALRIGTQDYAITGTYSTQANPAEVCALTLPGLLNTRVGALTERVAVIGRSNTGSVFVLGYPAPAQFPSTAALGLYTVSLVGGALALTRIGGPTPPQIDAAWVHFTAVGGISTDLTDGNPIIMVQTADAVANQNYFVKLNKATGAVVWTCAVAGGIDANVDADMNKHLIKNQTLYYLNSANLLYTINTSTGVATTATIGALALGGNHGQVSEDVNNSIFIYGTWSETTTHPNYIGDYMGTGGHHALATNTWIRYFPAGPTPPLPSAPPTPAPVAGPYINLNRAWTFTLDGHTFYVLDLGSEGTFVYDVTTQQWSQFSTDATTPQWNMKSGVMWGQRIVAGDSTASTIWELVPGATQDNGADISHTVTGGLTLRTRVYRSCDAVRVAASFGQLDDPASAVFTLSYSDDYGQTWVTPSPITLTEGNFGDEIAWNSLGSFMSPGRLFQLSDVGGLIRIDGCDAMLDNFDDDQPQEQA